MSTLSLRLPDSLHNEIKSLAKKEGISINQFISTALAEKMSALDTEKYLTERANRGSRQVFDRAMSKVRDREPMPGDEL